MNPPSRTPLLSLALRVFGAMILASTSFWGSFSGGQRVIRHGI
jgi:hypothetical protein